VPKWHLKFFSVTGRDSMFYQGIAFCDTIKFYLFFINFTQKKPEEFWKCWLKLPESLEKIIKNSLSENFKTSELPKINTNG